MDYLYFGYALYIMKNPNHCISYIVSKRVWNIRSAPTHFHFSFRQPWWRNQSCRIRDPSISNSASSLLSWFVSPKQSFVLFFFSVGALTLSISHSSLYYFLFERGLKSLVSSLFLFLAHLVILKEIIFPSCQLTLKDWKKKKRFWSKALENERIQ